MKPINMSRVAILIVGLVSFMVDVAATASPTEDPGGEMTGPEAGLTLVEAEIEHLQAKRISEDDLAMQTLLELKTDLQELADGPALPEPDPAEVDRLLNLAPSEPSWDHGEVPCEGGSDRHALESLGVVFEGVTLRCAVVPRQDGSALMVFVSDEGWAMARKAEWASIGGSAEYALVDIPVIADLSSVSIELVGEDLQLEGADGLVVLETDDWF